jgi:uncharacterized membrane protein
LELIIRSSRSLRPLLKQTTYDINNEGKNVIDNNNEDPIRIIKRRLAKGEISKEEYEELRKAIEL